MRTQNSFFGRLSLSTAIFLGLGGVLVGTGLTIGWLVRMRTHGLPQVEGTVVSLKPMASGRDRCHAPVVDYQVRGVAYRFTPSSSWSCQLVPSSVGDKIVVFYPPNNPPDGRIHNVALRWFVPGLLISIGGILGTVGGAVSIAVGRGDCQSSVVTSVHQQRQVMRSASATTLAEIEQLLEAGEKVSAIKAYMKLYGVSLKEAKTAIEEMDRH